MKRRATALTLAPLPLASTQPLPADSPIGGPLWSIVVPALLFALAFVATWMLYRHFSRK
jgi:hypothetical protein